MDKIIIFLNYISTDLITKRSIFLFKILIDKKNVFFVPNIHGSCEKKEYFLTSNIHGCSGSQMI
jgi:hypothetical protein